MSTELSTVEQTTNFLAVIAKAAADPACDVGKMEKLLDMQERVNKSRAEQEFNAAMVRVQTEAKKIRRNKDNTSTSSKYADLESLNDLMVPAYTQEGFALSFGTADCPISEHYRVTCVVSHAGGFSRHYQADVPLDNLGPRGSPVKTKTHGFGSSMSYGRRYLTMMIFNLTLTNEDDDGNGGETSVIDEDQIKHLHELLAESKRDLPKFLSYMRVTEMSEIPASQYKFACSALERTIAENKAEAEKG